MANNALLSYGTHPAAPKIEVPAVSDFKSDRTLQAHNYFESAASELNEKYQQLVQLANDSKMVYDARYNFIPKVGKDYYLYWTGKDNILTIIDNWSKYEYIGTFVLTTDNVWKRKGDE